MEENDKFEKPIEFYLNREITNIHKTGVHFLDEKIDKGILMPLNFQFKKIFEIEGRLEFCLNQIERYKKNEPYI